MKGHDPFEEDRHLMSRGPVSDYSFVFAKWTPFASVSYTTEWDAAGDQVEFRITVRRVGGPVNAVCRMPKLETKDGKAAFTAAVRKRLIEGIETK